MSVIFRKRYRVSYLIKAPQGLPGLQSRKEADFAWPAQGAFRVKASLSEDYLVLVHGMPSERQDGVPLLCFAQG